MKARPAEPTKQDRVRAAFVAKYGNDPEVWALFQGYVKTVAAGVYRTAPVSVREFYSQEYYCGTLANTIFPVVLDAVEACCSGEYIEGVFTGGIGTSKTTAALLGTFYTLYQLSLMWSPQKEFGLLETDEIIFVFQSLNAKLARAVDFERFRSFVEGSKYFMTQFAPDADIKSELKFPNRIIVKPISGTDTAAIGQNVFGGIIDEVNFMKMIETSKSRRDSSTYDQAQELYNAIKRRRESRFMKKGKIPGILFLVSSKRYPGEFTEQKQIEAKREIEKTGKTSIYIYDKRVWEVQPHKFNNERFNVFIGDMSRQPRIMKEGEVLPPEDAHLSLAVPEDYRSTFELDILAALRDVGGAATMAIHPFILDPRKISRCFGKTESVLSRASCDFVDTSVAIQRNKLRRLNEPRFLHIDLAIRGDSAGVACGYVPRFVQIERSKGVIEALPEIVYDFVLEVAPPKSGEIVFEKIRTLIYKLRELGMKIRWVTLDSFQSRDTIQILRSKGIAAGLQSMDLTTVPYSVLKGAILDDRMLAPECERAQIELTRLEQNERTGKIDHPPVGSKDLSDAMAGVAYGLTTRREIWATHKVLQHIPGHLKQANIQGGQTA